MLMLVVTIHRPWHSGGEVPSLLQYGPTVTLVLGMAHRLYCHMLLVAVSHEHFSVLNTGFCVSVALIVHCSVARGLSPLPSQSSLEWYPISCILSPEFSDCGSQFSIIKHQTLAV